METNEKLVSVLNDLIQINNDRIAGYDKAIVTVDATDVDLKTTFRKMADQSESYRLALSEAVSKLGGTVADGTTNLGKIYRVWMDVKNTFSGDDRQSALDTCEGGEDAALKAYKEALASDAEMHAEVRQLITSQQAEIKTAHDIIKKYRDLNATVNA
jgi:uncharacterized protein (TIGR02284 family)